jgi:hypothetical protein
MRPEYTRLAGLQGSIIIIGAALTYFVVAPLVAKSFAYGGSVALVSTLFLSMRLSQGGRRAKLLADWCLRQAYRTAIERFVGVILLLAIGFRLLKFAPLWMLVGFIAAQAAWVLMPVWVKLDKSLEKTEYKNDK